MVVQGDLAVARLVTLLGEVRGRKRLQKIVHLLKAKGHRDFRQDFVLHYYGPFSREVATQLDFVCAADLVDESESGDMYVYKAASREHEDRAKRLLATDTDPPWVGFARELNNRGTPFLEALSTVVHLHKVGLQGRRLKSEFEQLKPGLKAHFAKAKAYAKQHQLA